jgi:hypothetical protein
MASSAPPIETHSHLRVVAESFVFPLPTLDLNPDYFDVAEMPWVESKWQEIGKTAAAFRRTRPFRSALPRCGCVA